VIVIFLVDMDSLYCQAEFVPKREERKEDMEKVLMTVLIALCGDENTTLGTVRQFVESDFGKEAGEMSLNEFLALSDGASAPKAKRGKAPKKAPKAKASGKVNTRTEEGRQAYDASVLAFVKKEKECQAIHVRAACGGSPDQARKALNRLIEAGEITYEGKARATKYLAS
jgi:hypothetical protein